MLIALIAPAAATYIYMLSLDQSVRTLGQMRNTSSGTINFIKTVALSRDGSLVASSVYKTATIWNADNGQALRTLAGHSGNVNAAVFSPDGKLLASASDDQTVRLWDVSGGQLVRVLTGHAKAVNSVAFSANGKLLATASQDQSVRVWDATGGQLIATLTDEPSSMNAVAFSPDGKWLASADSDGKIVFWDVTNWTSGGELDDFHGENIEGRKKRATIRSIAYSPDGMQIVSATSWGIYTWKTMADYVGNRFIREFSKIESYSVAFTTDGEWIVSGVVTNNYPDHYVVGLWSADRKLVGPGRQAPPEKPVFRSLGGHAEHITAVATGSEWIASGSYDETVKLWKAP
jgi:WD40 repeat protein